MSARVPVLWQFRQSHYNEKARWALDWKGVRHIRRSLLPGLHVARVLWMTRQKSVPVLVLDGRAIADSTRIIAAVEALRPDPPLYPAPLVERRRALELEEFFDEELGPHLRRSVFHDILPHTEYASALVTTGFPPLVRTAYRAAFPALRVAFRMDMRISDEGAALGRAKVITALDRIEAELQPSGYLVGEQFSVADLTAAALLSPLISPPEYPYPLPGPWPEPLASFRASLAGHRAYAWASEMYRRHRGTSAEITS
ncbi:MAG: glutathione S-transferase [Deltaproteobacteria bacterium]|nr:MAG: glutathione S-transferase [Deltaproteobacteria bacterium]